VLTAQERATALRIAMTAATTPLRTGQQWFPDPSELTGELAAPGACFVTLTGRGQLLGCIGSLEPRRPLGEDIAAQAFAAAFRDPRMPALTDHDLPELHVEVSVLGPLEPLEVAGRAQLAEVLRPGIDGLLIESGWHRATFLPAVWRSVSGTPEFLDLLWRKAGMRPRDWPRDLTVHTYCTDEFGAFYSPRPSEPDPPIEL